jgi:glutathione synthase/RimK-type ligase-like ATP-grasp enzyme
MAKTLFLLVNSCGNIPQKLHETTSLSLGHIEDKFSRVGYLVYKITIELFINDLKTHQHMISGSFFFYASSQYDTYKSSIEDVLLYIQTCGGILIPEFIHLRAHENKFLQILQSNRLDLQIPNSVLVNTTEHLEALLNREEYPLVAKLSSGYGSSSVQKVKNAGEAKDFVADNFTETIKARKNFIARNRELKRYKGTYPLKTGKVLFQKFIDGTDHDWKVLVFGDKLFTLKRYYNKDDFRASGSGNFDFSAKPTQALLDFALKISKKLDSPFASLDIICDGDAHRLLEYQCLHFGLMTAINSTCHYVFNGSKFDDISGTIDIDEVISETLYAFIEDKLHTSETRLD